MNLKFWFNIFIYLSLSFLLLYLFRSGYLFIPKIHSIHWLLASFFFLFSGFAINAYAWQVMLNSTAGKFSYSTAVASMGLSIFGKYLPGKFWTIVGRAAYITDKKAYSIFYISGISFLAQIFAILTGSLLGCIGLWYYLNEFFSLVLVISFILLIFFLLPLNKMFLSNNSWISDKTYVFRLTCGPHLIKILPWYFIFWIFWGIGFYCLTLSLSGLANWLLAPAFILAGSSGIMIFFIPGGIGVREGLISFFLIEIGYSPDLTATIAIGSRLWFLTGEIFIFTCGLIADRRVNHIENKKSSEIS